MKFLSKFKKIIVVIGILIVVLIITALISVTTFTNICEDRQSDFVPIENTPSEEILYIQESNEGYLRREDTSYITFPEWYLVFNPQEYGDFLTENHPSDFPYFGSIGQFWHSYCEVYGITSNNYPSNVDNHIVEVVIGVSFTGEYIVKGIYENTFGRITEIFVEPNETKEDILATKIAKEYGEFIPTTPWYEFPFGQAFKDLWTKTGFFGENIIRKTERKFFLSIEYGIKAIYAKIINISTQAKFGTAVTEIYAHVDNVSEEIFINPVIKKVQKLSDNTYIITVPHYQGFTDEVPKLSKEKIHFISIAGNDEILISVVSDIDWQYNLETAKELFNMPIIINPSKKRTAIQVPVENLAETLIELDNQNIFIEHLFDY